MINKQGMIDAVNAKFALLSDADKVNSEKTFEAWIYGINEYLVLNMELQMAYVGTIPTPPGPDPLSGSYTYATILAMSPSAIQSAVASMVTPSSAFSAFKTALQTALKATVYVGIDKTAKVTITAPLLLTAFSFNIVQDDIKDCAGFGEVLDVMCDKLVSSLTGTVVTSMAGAATSITPGSGTVTGIQIQ